MAPQLWTPRRQVVGAAAGPVAAAETVEPAPNTFIGQHILKDGRVVKAACELIPAGAPVVEIGAGPGTLTSELLRSGHAVRAYEVDGRWKPALDYLGRGGGLEVRWQSFLDADNDELNSAQGFQLVGNIPYHISEPLVYKMTELLFGQAVLLVGDRLARSLTVGNPDQPNWSRMSLLSHAYFDVDRVADVPRTSFDPVPRADGALIAVTRKDADEGWRRDAVVRSYRALVEAGRQNSTAARALKTVLVDSNGRALGSSSAAKPDKRASHQAERSDVRQALRAYVADYNGGGESRQGRPADLRRVGETMLSLVARTVDERLLSKPLSGLSNQDLRRVCSAISSAINQRTKR